MEHFQIAKFPVSRGILCACVLATMCTVSAAKLHYIPVFLELKLKVISIRVIYVSFVLMRCCVIYMPFAALAMFATKMHASEIAIIIKCCINQVMYEDH